MQITNPSLLQQKVYGFLDYLTPMDSLQIEQPVVVLVLAACFFSAALTSVVPGSFLLRGRASTQKLVFVYPCEAPSRKEIVETGSGGPRFPW